MTLTITINTENAAFEGTAGIEVARLLRKQAARLEDWPGGNEFSFGVYNANGNRVGTVAATE